MAFQTLNERLERVAECALTYCRNRFGKNGVKIEEEIHSSISWKPTFFLKSGRLKIIAFEVDDNLYPEILKIAAHDINHYDFPIAVYQVCTLESFQSDRKQLKINRLRDQGFGIITVDDDNKVAIQNECVPVAQNIPIEKLENDIKPLTPKQKVSFRAAHQVYRSDANQGLQKASQIVESLVKSLCSEAVKHGLVTNNASRLQVAGMIDALYETSQFTSHRAALGGARGFIKEFRNSSSHPPKNGKEAAEQIKKCKRGFLEAIEVSVKLRKVGQALGYKLAIEIA